jgi:hypothetical protein
MKNILVISNRLTRFVQDDIYIIESTGNKVKYLHNNFWSWDLLKSIIWSDKIFSWFNSKHTIFPFILAKLFHKKIIIITGGYDTAYCPDINYGLRCNKLVSKLLNIPLNFCDDIIVNSYFAYTELMSYGIINSNIFVIYHALTEKDNFSFHPRKKQILYVGDVTEANLERKGLKHFLLFSNSIKTHSFICVGKISKEFKKYLSQEFPNVYFTGFINDNQLIKYWKESSIIFQMSIHEAFGLSVVQAMYYGCVPVIFNNSGALSEITSPFGFTLEKYDETVLKNIIKSVNDLSIIDREVMSKNISEKYHFEKRKTIFNKILNK